MIAMIAMKMDCFVAAAPRNDGIFTQTVVSI
jgi:hypothetical protein